MLPDSEQISIVSEVPAALHKGIQEFLSVHPELSENDLVAGAIALLLLQSTSVTEASRRAAGKVYLRQTFPQYREVA